MTMILTFQATAQLACLYLAFALATDASRELEEVDYWRFCAVRAYYPEATQQAGMFRAYGHATQAYDRACASIGMMLLTGLAGLAVAFLG
jgi:hypothetical protein